MGTARLSASSISILTTPATSLPSSRSSAEHEPPTVEESPELELIGVLRQAAGDSSQALESLLDALADAARVLSGADGTALALQSRGIFVCRARSGNIAPELGAPMNSESGISGECIRTATMLICHDSLADPRVDAEVCRSLGIRSVVAVPVVGGMGVGGILEAFSARPNAFDGDALSSLRALAEIAGTAYAREAPELAPVARPMASIGRASAISSPPLVADEVLGSSESSKSRLWIVCSIAMGLVLTVGVAWWSWHVPAEEIGGEQQVARAASPEPARSTNAPGVMASPKPTPGFVGRRPEQPQSEALLLNAAELKPVEEPVESAPTAASPSGNVPARSPSGNPSEGLVTEAPLVDLAPSANSEELARLTSGPAPLPAGGPRISEGVVEPSLIHKVDPTYPLQARTQRLSGKVTLAATIGADGSIRELSVLSGSSVLAAAAQAAVRQWRYHPATLNGNPVEVQKQITFVFQLP